MGEKKSDTDKPSTDKLKGIIVKTAEPAKTVQEPVKPAKTVQEPVKPAKTVQEPVKPAKTVQEPVKPPAEKPVSKTLEDARKGHHRTPNDMVHAPIISIPKDLGLRAHFLAKLFVGALILELFAVIGGAAWAIGDQFSTNKAAWFLTLQSQWQIIIIALIAFAAFVIFFGLVILYRRGRNMVLKALYGKIVPTDEIKEFGVHRIPRLVVGITMISALVLLSGFLLLLVEISTTGGVQVDGEMAFVIGHLTGGERALIVIAFIVIMTALLLAFLFLWQTGYNYIMTKLARINKKFKQTIHGLNSDQERKSTIMHAAIVVSIVFIVFGLIWWVLDLATIGGTPWEIFVEASNFGMIIVFFGLFFTIISLVLIVLMMRYYWLHSIIDHALFDVKHALARSNASTSQRVVAIGLISTLYVAVLFLIIAGLLFLVSPLIPIDIIGFFIMLSGLNLGESVLGNSSFVLLAIILLLSSVYFLFNGYGYLLDKFEHLEEHLDEPVHKILDHPQQAKPVKP